MKESITKRATVYFEADLHKALKLKSAETERTLSSLVNEAARALIAESRKDLKTRSSPPWMRHIKRIKIKGEPFSQTLLDSRRHESR